jgi:hypothetical protein
LAACFGLADGDLLEMMTGNDTQRMFAINVIALGLWLQAIIAALILYSMIIVSLDS